MNLVNKILTLIVFVMLGSRGYAADYEYKGVFPTQTLMLEFCDDCWLELPPDFLATSLVLNVATDSHNRLFKAFQKSALAQGWNLTRSGNILKAEPVQNAGNLVYISCLDDTPHNVEKYLYAASVKADSIKCAKRDSTIKRQQFIADSLQKRQDSLAKIPPLNFKHYELRYYAYSKSFTDKIGVEWQQIIAAGNLHNRFKIFDDWRVIASQMNDTSYNERKITFSVDSSITIDWGAEEQTMLKTYLTDGVVSQDFEWRKYGLIINVKRDGERVKMDYTFRDKDNSISILQGSVIGAESDTLRLFGDYLSKREIKQGVPLLSQIPVVGWFFATNQTLRDLKAFELYLVPVPASKQLKSL